MATITSICSVFVVIFLLLGCDGVESKKRKNRFNEMQPVVEIDLSDRTLKKINQLGIMKVGAKKKRFKNIPKVPLAAIPDASRTPSFAAPKLGPGRRATHSDKPKTEYVFAEAGGPLANIKKVSRPPTVRPQLPGPQFQGPQFAGHQLQGPQLPGPQLPGPQIPGPQLQGLQLSGPQLAGPQISGAQILGSPQPDFPQRFRPKLRRQFAAQGALGREPSVGRPPFLLANQPETVNEPPFLSLRQHERISHQSPFLNLRNPESTPSFAALSNAHVSPELPKFLNKPQRIPGNILRRNALPRFAAGPYSKQVRPGSLPFEDQVNSGVYAHGPNSPFAVYSSPNAIKLPGAGPNGKIPFLPPHLNGPPVIEHVPPCIT